MIEKLKNIFTSKPILPLAGVFLLLLSVFLGVYLVQQRTQLKSRAAADTAILSFVPSSASAGLSQEVSFNVSFNRGTGTKPPVITGVDLHISTDNSNIQIVRFTPDTGASKFNTELRNEVGSDGLSFRYIAINTADTASLPTNQAVNLGRLVVRTMAAGSSNIRLETATQIVASGYKDAVPLDLTRTAVVTITGPTTTGCECSSANTCTSICPFTTLTGVTYANPIGCSLASGISETIPSAADKNSWCNRTKRTQGDADGNGSIDAIDYTYYLRTVLSGRIPPNVNPDFDGDGRVSPEDLVIWNRGQGQ